MEESFIEIDDCWNRNGVWGKERPRCAKLDAVVHCANCDVYMASGRRLLSRPVPQGYLEQWGHFLADEAAQKEGATESLLVFYAAGVWLALPTHLLIQVIEHQPVHSLPHNHNDIVKGIVNAHGEMVVCLAVAQLLGLESTLEPTGEGQGTGQRMVVFESEGFQYAFDVDHIGGMARIRPAELCVGAQEYGFDGELVIGVLRWHGKNVGYIDASKLARALQEKLR